jgi:hypothetical protein
MPTIPIAEDFHQMAGDLFFWSAFDPASKAELFSTGILLPSKRVVLIDPIQLSHGAFAEFSEVLNSNGAKPAAIFVTSINHARAASLWKNQFQIPIFASEGAVEGLRADGLEIDYALNANQNSTGEFSEKFAGEVSFHPLPGFAKGETAYFFPKNQNTLVVGDAILNLPPFGFCPLPSKYCEDHKQTADSLKSLVELNIQRLCFAHGEPMMSGAHARILSLLA